MARPGSSGGRSVTERGALGQRSVGSLSLNHSSGSVPHGSPVTSPHLTGGSGGGHGPNGSLVVRVPRPRSGGVGTDHQVESSRAEYEANWPIVGSRDDTSSSKSKPRKGLGPLQEKAAANADASSKTGSQRRSTRIAQTAGGSNSHVDPNGRDTGASPAPLPTATTSMSLRSGVSAAGSNEPTSSSRHDSPGMVLTPPSVGGAKSPAASPRCLSRSPSVERCLTCQANGCDHEERFTGRGASQQRVDHYYDLLKRRVIDANEMLRCMQEVGSPHMQCKKCHLWLGSQHYHGKHSQDAKCIAVRRGKDARPLPDVSSPPAGPSVSGDDAGEQPERVDAPRDTISSSPAEDEVVGGLGSAQQIAAAQLFQGLFIPSNVGGGSGRRSRGLPPWSQPDGANGQGSGAGSSSTSDSGDVGNGDGGQEDRGDADSRGSHSGDGGNREDEPTGNETDDRSSLDEIFGGMDMRSNTGSIASGMSSGGRVENAVRGASLPQHMPSATGTMQAILERENVRFLQAIPKDSSTWSVLCEVIRKVLEEIDSATDPAALFRGWLKFFELPNEIFAIGRRGGTGLGQRHISVQLAKKVHTWYDAHNRQLDGGGLLNADSDQDEGDLEAAVGSRSDPRDDKLNALRRASHFLSRGHLSRAFKALCANAPVSVDDVGLDIIKAHFPAGDLGKLHELEAPPLVTDTLEVQKAIKTCANGGAAGPSQWAPDLFRIMLGDDDLCYLYGRVLVSLVNKKDLMTQELADLLLGAKVVAIAKPSLPPKALSLRPICVSEACLQHLQMMALKKVPQNFIDNIFKLGHKLLQYGVGVTNGVERAFRTIEAAMLLAQDGDIQGVAALLADVSSAFQHLDREAILKEFGRHKETKPLYGVLNLCFLYSAPRYVRMGEGSVRVLSQTCGGAQGWIIMPFVYCLTTLRALMDASTPALGSTLLSATVLDDTNLFGQVQVLMDGFDKLEGGLSDTCCLKLNVAKTVVVSPFDEALSDQQTQEWEARGIVVATHAPLLGAVVATDDEKLKDHIEAKVGLMTEKSKRVLDMLRDPRLDLQSFLLYVTQSVQHMLGFAARLLPPSLAEGMFRDWDKALLELVLRKCGRNEMLEDGHLPKWDERLKMEVLQLTLPVDHGGIGLLPMRKVSLAAWIASVAASADDILAVMDRPELKDPAFPNRPPIPPARYQAEYAHCRTELVDLAPKLENACHSGGADVIGELKLLPPTLLEFLRQYQQYPKTKAKLQAILMRHVWDEQLEQVKKFHAESPTDLRRINSYTSGIGIAGRIWKILPTSPKLRMSDELMAQTLRLQLGALPAAWMYLVDDALECPTCKNKVSIRDVPAHSNHCATNRRTALTDRHNQCAHCLCDAAKKNHVPYVWEMVDADHKKPDITFLFPQHDIVVDVAVVAPEAPSKQGNGQKNPLAAAEDMANVKFKKYHDLVEKSGGVFIPAIFQTSGAYTLDTALLIKRICMAGVDNGVENPLTTAELRDWLAVSIQRGNAIANVLTAARLRAKHSAFAKARPLLASRAFARGRGARRDNLEWARQVNAYAVD